LIEMIGKEEKNDKKGVSEIDENFATWGKKR
jgi:hypothetical protein